MKFRVVEDTVKTASGKWVNRGKEGTHGKFETKKKADAQRKAMFASGYKAEGLKESLTSSNPTIGDLVDFLRDKANELENRYDLDQVVSKVSNTYFLGHPDYFLGIAGYYDGGYINLDDPIDDEEDGDEDEDLEESLKEEDQSKVDASTKEDKLDETLDYDSVWVASVEGEAVKDDSGEVITFKSAPEAQEYIDQNELQWARPARKYSLSRKPQVESMNESLEYDDALAELDSLDLDVDSYEYYKTNLEDLHYTGESSYRSIDAIMRDARKASKKTDEDDTDDEWDDNAVFEMEDSDREVLEKLNQDLTDEMKEQFFVDVSGQGTQDLTPINEDNNNPVVEGINSDDAFEARLNNIINQDLTEVDDEF